MRKLLMVLTATASVAVVDDVVLEMNNGDLIVCDNNELFIKTTIDSGKIMYLPTHDSYDVDPEYIYDLAEYGDL